MINPSDLLVFLAALIAVYLMPGPDMALVVSTSVFRGPRNGILVALGLALSRTLHVTFSALGLAALIHTHPMLFDAVRWIGAAYLLWLAWKLLRSGEHGAAKTDADAGAGRAAIRQGIMTNLLNPKALMFCALLLPQFISAQHDLSAQYLVLGAILVVVGFLFDLVYALAACRIAKRSSVSPSMQRMAKRVFASIFGFAAIRLVVDAT